MKKMARLGLICGVLGVALVAGGCFMQRYYCVTDPASGKKFYAPRVKKDKSGAATFVNVRSGQEMTVTNAQVKSMKRADFQREVHAP
jgi:hypothetical protein